MKNFLAHITEQVPEIFNYEKKEILSLAGEESKSYNNQILSDIYKKILRTFNILESDNNKDDDDINTGNSSQE